MSRLETISTNEKIEQGDEPIAARTGPSDGEVLADLGYKQGKYNSSQHVEDRGSETRFGRIRFEWGERQLAAILRSRFDDD
jgi:hypothetical protein